MRDVMLVEGAPEFGPVRHVSLHECHAFALVGVEDDPEPRVVASEVVADGLLAVVEQAPSASTRRGSRAHP